jgi:hypothetical protein
MLYFPAALPNKIRLWKFIIVGNVIILATPSLPVHIVEYVEVAAREDLAGGWDSLLSAATGTVLTRDPHSNLDTAIVMMEKLGSLIQFPGKW